MTSASPASTSSGRYGRVGTGSLLVVEVPHGFGQRGDHLESVAHDAVVGDLEDGSVGVLVDRHDAARGGHAGQVLDGPRDADRHVEFGRNRLAGLADLVVVGTPP